MNKKAQMGPVGAILLFAIFMVNWFIWLGSWVNTVGNMMVVNNGLTGIEAFFLTNLNFFVFIGIVLGMLGFMYFSSSQ